MQTNIGTVDRVLRIILGVGLLGMLIWVSGPAKWWGLIGLVPLATAVFRWCPAYVPFGIRTCPADGGK
ncbi:MAG: DUF2892 domain-containing protein [Rhodospirillales bacterium]|nr:MAG: DUF2892 domain-containing protein [Rhodospirillales bacterium]